MLSGILIDRLDRVEEGSFALERLLKGMCDASLIRFRGEFKRTKKQGNTIGKKTDE
jgi:hypothetical protein